MNVIGAIRRSAIAAAALLAIGACASGHAHKGDASPENRTVVNLENDITPPGDVTVYYVAQGGTRTLLGDVPPNDHRAFKVPDTIQPGTTYRLVAEKTGGRRIVSQPITYSVGSAIVNWSLQQNNIWYPDPGE